VFQPDAFSIKFCGLALERDLTIHALGDDAEVFVASSDVLVAHDPASGQNLTVVWAASAVLLGQNPSLDATVSLENSAMWPDEPDSSCTVNVSAADSSTVALCKNQDELLWALAYHPSDPQAAVDLALAGLDQAALGIETVVTARLASFGALLPENDNAGGGVYDNLLAKSWSVMRVNALSPEGFIEQHWSTPDRMPHRWMWLWDSAFHAMGMGVAPPGSVLLNTTLGGGEEEEDSVMRRSAGGGARGVAAAAVAGGGGVAPTDIAWEYLKSVLDGADNSTGAIAIERSPTDGGSPVDETQPPVLSWAVLDNFNLAQKTAATAAGDDVASSTSTISSTSTSSDGDNNDELVSRLEFAAPKLDAYLEWDRTHRGDPTGGSLLLSWSAGGESGMDNSQRFDATPVSCRRLLAVDFSVLFAKDAAALADIYEVLSSATAAAAAAAAVAGGEGALSPSLMGADSKASYWRSVSANVSAAVHSVMWDESRGLYADVLIASDGSRSFSPINAVTSFYPLWLPDCPPERIEALVAALDDASKWSLEVPLPSVALGTERFSTDMWRGPFWVNTNYIIALALLDRSHPEPAYKLLAVALDCLASNYELYGALFEFYDSQGQADPRTLLRKGSATGGVRDYHWSAALAFRIIIEYGAEIAPYSKLAQGL
jgi:hypothetical protein